MTNRKKKLSRIMSNVRFLKSGPKSNPYLTRSLRGPANDLHARSRSDRVAWMGGWMDGWVGDDILPLSIFLIFKYVNK